MPDDIQTLLGLAASIIGLAGSLVYIGSIFKGQSKPHLFTWLIWGILGAIGFMAQISGEAGPGAWVTGIMAASAFTTAALALRYGEKEITVTDKVSLAAAMAAIVLWLLTDNPVGSVVLISIIDGVAFYPTIRKSWKKPLEENLASYLIANIKLILSLFALHNFSVTTALYPVSIVILNGGFIVMCLVRRKTLKNRAALAKTGA